MGAISRRHEKSSEELGDLKCLLKYREALTTVCKSIQLCNQQDGIAQNICPAGEALQRRYFANDFN